MALERGAGEGRELLGVTGVAELVGREKSQVSRSLKVLAEYGFVERDRASRGYRLGWRLFALAARAGDGRLLAAATPLLRRLVSGLGETAHLSVLQGASVLTVLSESPSHAVQAAGWIGRTVPVHCTSSGRALLFDHGREQLEALLGGAGLPAAGAAAPKDVATLLDRIGVARDDGYALVDEEFEPGLVAVAAPVRGRGGEIVAAVNVSAPKFRFGGELRAAGKTIRQAAAHLSSELGWAPEPALAGVDGRASHAPDAGGAP